ncbi:hypothetical protein BU23DRAFT_293723 [Bimuria novae-zelandiae CBS 107.79]|uniref:Uncharacterized protein n=1 Tax=Bimuria novae-zelandiae CBS 107.79 TaxID=1447943 RepID=A0A6A5VLG0_9PLEO|nr:hypothetical protein BU23DRAFT_293723 [Bimuria novae-zelandiae CBS 107.79]
MHYGHSRMPFNLIVAMISLPAPLLSLIALLPMTTVAQSTTSSLTSEATISTSTSRSQFSPTRSMTTSFTSSIVSNTTTPSSSSPTDSGTPPTNDILPGSSLPDQDPNERVFHYYWLILALFGVFVATFLWWINRRRRKRKEQMRLSGQNALARDMEGWINTRRWFHGAWRPNQTRAFLRREEGLNEHGEAPPPYQAKDDVTVTQGPPQDPASGLSIPLRTLSRDEVDAGRPPDYRDMTSRGKASTIRPGTATSHGGAADSAPRSSIRNLIPEHSAQEGHTRD